MTQPIRVAMAGLGTVGTGVARLLVERGDALRSRTGLTFQIARVLVRDPGRVREVALPGATFVTVPGELLADDSLDVVVEVMGGTTVARELVLAALRKGLPVVTANKALMALHGREVFGVARQHGTCVAFEASCAGGVPVIAALQRCLIANRITAIRGTVNGTCNYVLTEMIEHGRTYDDALRDAQRRGYAEPDPTLDVDGTDSAHKLAILASLALGADVTPDCIPTEGIQHLDATDLRIARGLGYACKLLALGARTDAALTLRVHPALVPASDPVAQVQGPLCAVVFEGDAMEWLFLAGSGAGSLPTASAVVSDLVEVACGNARHAFRQLRLLNDQNPPPLCLPADRHVYRYYVRCPAGPRTGSHGIESAFASHNVPVETHRAAREVVESAGVEDLILLTGWVQEGDFLRAMAEWRGQARSASEPRFLRIVEAT